MIRKSSFYRMLQIGLVLSQFLPGTLLTVEAAQLLYENTFTNGMGDIEFEALPMQPPSCVDTKFSVVRDPAGGGSKVAKVFQQGGLECIDIGNRHRALMRANYPSGNGIEINKYGTDYFFGVRFYIEKFDPAYYDANGFSHIFWNIKSVSARESMIDMVGNNGQVRLRVNNRWSVKGKDTFGLKKAFNVPDGQWVDLIIQVRREANSTGILKVWMNGKLVVNFVNTRTATAPSEVTKGGPYTRLGTYWGTKARKKDVIVYFDDWRIASGSDGFDLVNPSNGSISGSGDSLGLAAPPSPPIIQK